MIRFFQYKLSYRCSMLITMLLACLGKHDTLYLISLCASTSTHMRARPKAWGMWLLKISFVGLPLYEYLHLIAGVCDDSETAKVPCFFLWIMSVRRMSLDHHPGFDSGGILWFQDLTVYPHGVLGPIVPLIIAGLHFTNVQISFQKSSLQHIPGTLGLLAKIYRIYLQLLTLPILIATFNVPQGSLVYWLTNGSLSLIQYSVKILTDGRRDTAIGLLRLALEKDPDHARALLIMGQTLLQNKQFAEAAESLESAISKLLVAGHPTEVEKIDLLILSSQWAGIANIRQGKMEEGLLHLERIAQLEEPEGPKIKAHYYDGLFMLSRSNLASSALLNVDRKAEALKYLQMCAAYDPAYNAYFELLETDSTDFASDLASSRRDF
ncbi:UNVERIFIED_CONTAM: ALBINO3-like protein 3, mitochondrial [Sesamum latifolium]|uniref:ALBINO3-like protein 3, mitochondrial n=1 Tax=Sesamum latifolium TaxID=2727402 RepID=A0AAW2UDG1_9LAMI